MKKDQWIGLIAIALIVGSMALMPTYFGRSTFQVGEYIVRVENWYAEPLAFSSSMTEDQIKNQPGVLSVGKISCTDRGLEYQKVYSRAKVIAPHYKVSSEYIAQKYEERGYQCGARTIRKLDL